MNAHRVDAGGEEGAQHRIAGKAADLPPVEAEAQRRRAVDGRAAHALGRVGGKTIDLSPHAAASSAW